ncbi:hypothetical protein AQ490_20430 [Wenjunlia vitaminophila]|uniref:histidine kinase n=1 Tax=Wenjunlia vitaminophila TaxID=76728 RepID=A0A0T6LTF1_WENVI|nr:hypothetical protein AQ490_20430 [Wenjunlia vitaminophila]
MPAQDSAPAHNPPRASAHRGNFVPPTNAPPPQGPPQDGGAGASVATGSRFALRNWRVPSRLLAILAIPMVAGLVFAGLRIADSVEYAQQAADAEQAAKLARSATGVANALENERDVSTLPLIRGDRDDPQVKQARAETDARVREFRADARGAPGNSRITSRTRAAENSLASLASLRQDAFTDELSPEATIQAYSDMFRPLNAFDNELGFGSSDINSRGRAVYALSLAKASSSTQRATVLGAFARDELADADVVTIRASALLEEVAKAEFLSGALPEDVELFQTEVSEERVGEANAYQSEVLGVPPGSSLAEAGLSSARWYSLASTEFDQMHQVEVQITDQIVAQAGDIKTQAQRDALINSVAALLMLLLAGLLTFFVARSMVRGMGVLRSSAMDIAEVRLPGLVENLSKTDPGRVDTRVEPIPLFGRDEIGEVARAFDQVHREAVRLAAEQALLRGNVNAIFTNLSRRNQGLIQRQLTLITDLENNEAEPDQLENLFKLDHLATRMRRNGENLLVLAGEEPGRQWTRPVPLVDVLRAAISEVEQYERIELTGIPETEINGTAVNDLVHLLAELLENATAFSSPQTKVRVNGTRLPDGRVMVEIHDQGIGLTPEDFTDINQKLANPPTVDVTVARRMGLFVVGRLAQRHDIRVQLRPSGDSSGTTSLVMLPEPVTRGGQPPELPDGFPVVAGEPGLPPGAGGGAAQVPSGPGAALDPAARGVTGGAADPGLDPVGRSLQREERRAALGATDQDAHPQAHAEGPANEPPYPVDSPHHPALPYREGLGYQEEPWYPGHPQGPADGPGYHAEPAFPHGQEHPLHPTADQWFPELRGWSEPAAGPGAEHEGAQYPGPPALPSGHPGDTSWADPGDSPTTGEPTPSSTGHDSSPYAPPFEGVSFTDSGLPRRQPKRPQGDPGTDGRWNWQRQPTEEGPAEGAPQTPDHPRGEAPEGADQWQSPNDDHWRRASQVRDPQASGFTPSGLPRRVPRANLIPGSAQPTPQDGPQVSRTPDEVRGRLTSLRRGIQQGRSESSDSNREGFGPSHQER